MASSDSSDSSDRPRDPDGEAMRRRICARLLGDDFDAVWLGRFRVVEAIGYGAMGVVYAAEDAAQGRRVAVKVLRDAGVRGSAGERGRLVCEARALARLAHPNVVRVHEAGEHDGDVFIVMELVPGTTLRAWLGAAPRPLAQVLACFVAAGEGLVAAQGVGVVHRTFTAADALVDERGRVRVVDLGLVARERPASMLAGCDARGDQRCFCAALFEAVYGAPVRSCVTSGGARVPADRRVPGWLRRVLARGLAARPEDRYASMAALVAALARGSRGRSMHRSVVAVVVILMIIVLMIIVGLAGDGARWGPLLAGGGGR